MIKIQSPFIQEIQECRTVMRKLRKKIYKHLLVSGSAKKSRDPNQHLLEILKSRNLPNFVLDTLKKRRNVDFNFLKNVIVSNMASPQEIAKLTSNQENEIQTIFTEHKQRLRKTISKPTFRMNKKQTNCTSQDEQSGQISMLSNLNNFSINQKQFSIEQEFMENHFKCDQVRLNDLNFISFQKDFELEEEWLHF